MRLSRIYGSLLVSLCATVFMGVSGCGLTFGLTSSQTILPLHAVTAANIYSVFKPEGNPANIVNALFIGELCMPAVEQLDKSV